MSRFRQPLRLAAYPPERHPARQLMSTLTFSSTDLVATESLMPMRSLIWKLIPFLAPVNFSSHEPSASSRARVAKRFRANDQSEKIRSVPSILLLIGCCSFGTPAMSFSQGRVPLHGARLCSPWMCCSGIGRPSLMLAIIFMQHAAST